MVQLSKLLLLVLLTLSASAAGFLADNSTNWIIDPAYASRFFGTKAGGMVTGLTPSPIDAPSMRKRGMPAETLAQIRGLG